MIIGIDFDNTIILYDKLVRSIASKMGFIPPSFEGDKVAVRDFIRSSKYGDEGWQRVQGQVYGKEIVGAVIADGFKEFIVLARKKQNQLYIVSHKTEIGHFDIEKINLRDAALGWMEGQGFFSQIEDGGLGFTRDEIFFRAERKEKIVKIKELQCEAFIDDLPEVFEEAMFPPKTKKILYAPVGFTEHKCAMTVVKSWNEIANALLS